MKSGAEDQPEDVPADAAGKARRTEHVYTHTHTHTTHAHTCSLLITPCTPALQKMDVECEEAEDVPADAVETFCAPTSGGHSLPTARLAAARRSPSHTARLSPLPSRSASPPRRTRLPPSRFSPCRWPATRFASSLSDPCLTVCSPGLLPTAHPSSAHRCMVGAVLGWASMGGAHNPEPRTPTPPPVPYTPILAHGASPSQATSRHPKPLHLTPPMITHH